VVVVGVFSVYAMLFPFCMLFVLVYCADFQAGAVLNHCLTCCAVPLPNLRLLCQVSEKTE